MKRFAAILAVALMGAAYPPTAQADFGIDGFDVTFTGPDGNPAHQAGSHPFATTISLGLNADGDEAEDRLRTLSLDLVPGLVANTTHPRCTAADFGMDDCSLATVVGIATSTFDESDQSTTVPVFNVVPPSGTPLRLGFRLAGSANVFVDLGLADQPPHNLIAEVSDIPEAIELFGIELQLWAIPRTPPTTTRAVGRSPPPRQRS